MLAGIFLTGHAILTPLLMVISMITGDFLAMLCTTDNVHVSPEPNVWHVGGITAAGGVLGFCTLFFCIGALAAGKYALHLGISALQTLSLVTLIFSGQAILYVVRERWHLWSSFPSPWLLAASLTDLLIIGTLSTRGILMTRLPVAVVLSVIAAAAIFGLLLDLIKIPVFRRLNIV